MENGMAQEMVTSYREGMGRLTALRPSVSEAYHRFTGECFEEGEISVKHKQLIALGVSLFANNETCTMFHAQEAMHEGASAEEILETAAVAAAVACGAVMSQSVTGILDTLDRRSGDLISH